jgi:hypothetical protein
MMLTPRTPPTAPRARACAGRKLASGIFLRTRKNRARKTCVKPLKTRQVAQAATTKTASGVCYYGFRYYNPSTGRWPNRDPLGDHAFFSRYTEGKSRKSVRDLEREALGPLYAFLSNDPLGKVDRTGLDRYITQFDIFGLGGSGGTQLHVGVAVDKWKVVNGKYVKDGVVTFDFSVDWEDADGDTDWWNIIKGATVGGRGRIVESSGLQLESPVTMTSSPCQDIKMLEMLRKEAQQPPRYVAAFFQCVFWSVGAVQYGMDQPNVEKCCPPSGP